MVEFDGHVIDLYVLASAEFERRLRQVGDWTASTPCTEWNIRQLVNHMVRGNVNYVALLEGGSGEVFMRLRDEDALGDDPLGAYAQSVRELRDAYRQPGALERSLDYPLAKVSSGQALAIRTSDVVVHTWDLARAIGGDDEMNVDLVNWVDENLDEIYAGLSGLDRFFAAPGECAGDESRQERLLRRMGR